MPEPASLYFHSPCFDGIASSVLTWDFLEAFEHWVVRDLVPVNYEMRDAWLSMTLSPLAAVVDFLYHPQARFWADHHQTTFLSVEAKLDFQRRKSPWLIYSESAGSCAALLWRHLLEQFEYRNQRYEALVKWADKIDAARYDSVQEAVFCDAPALGIRLSLGLTNHKSYITDLVRILRDETLERVVELPWVKRRIQRAQRLSKAGLKRLEKSCRVVNDDIVVFDVDTTGVLINRYAPYYFHPRARYSVGILRSANGAKITAMRNPWWDFPSLPLGKIFEKLGGGGHQRVGSLLLPHTRSEKASRILKKLVTEIHNCDVAAMGNSIS
jgi:hypothetical protein